MGKKGVSKRKPPKAKASPALNKKQSASSLVNEIASPAVQILDNGETISKVNGRNQKPTGSPKKNKKS
jgi:hypothetical protein